MIFYRPSWSQQAVRFLEDALQVSWSYCVLARRLFSVAVHVFNLRTNKAIGQVMNKNPLARQENPLVPGYQTGLSLRAETFLVLETGASNTNSICTGRLDSSLGKSTRLSESRTTWKDDYNMKGASKYCRTSLENSILLTGNRVAWDSNNMNLPRCKRLCVRLII